ncbi:MAG TPA: hypothetical protein VM686_00820 [Polyangiaceae bacterium]|nr:hypothetical protein [Polyangiaceae bacterium]
MVRLGCSLVLVLLVAACGKTEDNDNEKSGGGAGTAAGGGSGGASSPTAGAGAGAGTAGTANGPEALQRFTGTDVTSSQPYVAGMDLVVDHVKGLIRLVPGEPGVVSATFSPFTYRGASAETEATEDMMTGWSGEVLTEGNEISVISQQLGWDEVGAELTVEVPPEFDGAIKVVNQAAGEIEEADIAIDEGAVASAWSVHLQSLGLGDCDLDGAPTVKDTVVECRGVIEITNVSDDVTAYSDGLVGSDAPFGVRVFFAAISAEASGGDIESTDGNVELNLPAEGSFQITATPNADGAVNVVTPPDGCLASGNTVACGTGGAVYIASAGTDSLQAANVNMDFH